MGRERRERRLALRSDCCLDANHRLSNLGFKLATLAEWWTPAIWAMTGLWSPAVDPVLKSVKTAEFLTALFQVYGDTYVVDPGAVFTEICCSGCGMGLVGGW